jgi:hypothetical protein
LVLFSIIDFPSRGKSAAEHLSSMDRMVRELA